MTNDNDLIRRGDALKARTLWMKIDGEGLIDSICTAPFPDHDAYISYRAIEAIPAVTTPDPRDAQIAALVEAAQDYVNRIEQLERELSYGSFYKEKTIDQLMFRADEAEARVAALCAALAAVKGGDA